LDDLTGKIFCLNSQVVIEGFEDGALALRLADRHLIELNASAHWVVEHTDGERSVAQVADALAAEFQVPGAQALADVVELYRWLAEQHIVEIAGPPLAGKEKMDMTELVRYLCNPDVVLREEDPDEGALLFNPDTNQVKVLNPTGLFIWKQCGAARTLDEIAAEVQKGFEDAPADQVAQDVREFVEGMVATGFIGAVEKPGAG
jgi:hypothetical protein